MIKRGVALTGCTCELLAVVPFLTAQAPPEIDHFAKQVAKKAGPYFVWRDLM
jgi:hypothetical protein